MKVGDMVLFKTSGDRELRSGILKIGLLGMPYVMGINDEVYGFSMLDMVQVCPDGQKTGWKNYNIDNAFCSLFQSETCRI